VVNIVDVRDGVVPIRSDISNAFIDFSSMTVSVVAVVTDVSLLRSLKCEAHRTAARSGRPAAHPCADMPTPSEALVGLLRELAQGSCVTWVSRPAGKCRRHGR
jgi:hypothetical protein